MSWQPKLLRSDNEEMKLPSPVESVNFNGGNVVRSSAVPLVRGVLVSAVLRDAATVTITGKITVSPESDIGVDAETGNAEVTAIAEAKATLEQFLYPDVDDFADVYFRVYLAVSDDKTGHLFCERCRITDLSFNEDTQTAQAIPYSIVFTVPDGLLRYEVTA